jgi:beta-fructofuranosidase
MLLLYASDDALRWRYLGVLLEAADLEPDRHPDVVGIVWECPVLVRLHDTDVLVFSVMRDGPGPVVAVLGHLDGDRLVPRLVQRLDDGPSFYAPHPLRTPSGDVVLLGWLREREPRQSAAEGWSGAMSLPRRVRVEGGRLRVALDGAVEALRTAALPVLAGPRGPATSEWSVELTGDPVELALIGPVPPGHLEVQGVAADGSVFLRLTVGPGAATRVRHAGEASSTVLVDGEIGPGDPFEVRLCLDGSVLELSLGGTLTSSDRFYSAPMRGGRLRVHLEGSPGEVLVQAWSWATTGLPAGPVAADH